MPVTAFGEKPTADTGTILMWNGLLSDIPAGWVLCDGNNGTPNLLGKFLKEVPDMTTDPGATGGQDSLTLSSAQMPGHSHAGSIQSVGSHNHGIGTYGAHDGNGLKHEYDGISDTMWDDGYMGTSTNGAHSHAATSTATSGAGNSIDNRPAYHEVAYIMKT